MTKRPLWLRSIPGAAALLLSAAASMICLRLAGPAQGVLFGACIAVVLLAPAFASTAQSTAAAATGWLALSVGCLFGPLLAFRAGDLNAAVFFPTCAVVSSLALAGMGTTFLLTACSLGRSITAWFITLLLLAWLSWPIWLSHWLPGNERLVEQLSAAHPLLALDACLSRQNIAPWTEHGLMYNRLTVLQQHVMTYPPSSVGLASWLHGAIGAIGVLLAVLSRRLPKIFNKRKTTSDTGV